jgi:hypothetical protein
VKLQNRRATANPPVLAFVQISQLSVTDVITWPR